MKIENQVCNKEQAEKLKALGVNQESWFYHYQQVLNGVSTFEIYPLRNMENCEWVEDDMVLSALNGTAKNKVYSAFTVAELGVMLPEFIRHHFKFPGKTTPRSGEYDLKIERWFYTYQNKRMWAAQYRWNNDINIALPETSAHSYNEAETLAGVIISLLENTHITASEVNNRLTTK